MTDFLKGQMDYILFFHGLVCILLAPMCYFLNRRPRQKLPWMWLAAFGVAHGVNEWAGLLALGMGNGPIIDLARLCLATLSFLFLAEFGRIGMVSLQGRGPGRWVLLVLIGMAGLGGLAGMPGFAAATRYGPGFLGGLWATAALFLAAQTLEQGSWTLRSAALGTLGYSLFGGLVVNPAPFFPASLLNTNSFLAATACPSNW